MSSQFRTEAEISEAIRQELRKDNALEWQLASIPSFHPFALHGQPDEEQNWDLNVGTCSPVMAAAVQRAKTKLQGEVRLAAPFLGSTAIAP